MTRPGQSGKPCKAGTVTRIVAETDVDDLADLLSACLEGGGGIILSRILKNPQSVSKQILHYRDYLRLLYANDTDTQVTDDTRLN